MSKAHSSDGFRQRIKQLLGIRKGPAITSGVLEGPKSEEFVLHQELLQVRLSAACLLYKIQLSLLAELLLTVNNNKNI